MENFTTANTLGRYRLIKQIGRGGMGEVWLAEDPDLRRQVALKVLPQQKRENEEYLARFRREAQAAGTLNHPHILSVHDYGQQVFSSGQSVTYLVMPYISGGSVEDRLAQQRPLTQQEALDYLTQMAEAIDYAHTRGIIHRDIKPANMLLRDNNWLLLTDFGIAQIVTHGDNLTQTGAFLGTPTYMAPEQAQGHAVFASDIYSMAIIAYQFFTNQVPFTADTPYGVMIQHVVSAPASPLLYNRSLPPAFEIALLKGMAKDPAQRPSSALAFVASLRHALRMPVSPQSQVFSPPPGEVPAETARPSVGQTPKGISRRAVLIGAAGAVLVLGGGGVAAYALDRRGFGPFATQASPTPRTQITNAPTIATNILNSPVAHMAWSPVSSTLCTVSTNGTVALWSAPTSNAGTLTKTNELDEHTIIAGSALAWSPDGSKLAFTNLGYSSANGGSAEAFLCKEDLTPLALGTPIATSLAFQGIAWLSNTYLLTLGNFSSGLSPHIPLQIWNTSHITATPSTIEINASTISDDSAILNPLAVASDGITVAVGSNQSLLIGKITTGARVSWKQNAQSLTINGNPIGEISWSADSRYVAAANAYLNGSGASGVGIWDATRQFQQVQPGPNLAPISSILNHLAWSPDTQQPTLALGGTGGQVYLWKAGSSSSELSQPLPMPENLNNRAITALNWSHDGQWLAASYSDAAASILIWRM